MVDICEFQCGECVDGGREAVVSTLPTQPEEEGTLL